MNDVSPRLWCRRRFFCFFVFGQVKVRGRDHNVRAAPRGDYVRAGVLVARRFEPGRHGRGHPKLRQHAHLPRCKNAFLRIEEKRKHHSVCRNYSHLGQKSVMDSRCFTIRDFSGQIDSWSARRACCSSCCRVGVVELHDILGHAPWVGSVLYNMQILHNNISWRQVGIWIIYIVIYLSCSRWCRSWSIWSVPRWSRSWSTLSVLHDLHRHLSDLSDMIYIVIYLICRGVLR